MTNYEKAEKALNQSDGAMQPYANLFAAQAIAYALLSLERHSLARDEPGRGAGFRPCDRGATVTGAALADALEASQRKAVAARKGWEKLFQNERSEP